MLKYELGRIIRKDNYLIPTFSYAHAYLSEKEILNNYFE